MWFFPKFLFNFFPIILFISIGDIPVPGRAKYKSFFSILSWIFFECFKKILFKYEHLSFPLFWKVFETLL